MHINSKFPRTLAWQYWSLLAQLGISAYFLVTVILWSLYNLSFLILVFGFALIVANAIFMLTLDFARTDTYGGTLIAQMIISLASLVPPPVMMWLFTGEIFEGNIDPTSFILGGILILCSLCMIILLSLAKRAAARTTGLSWTNNARDVLLGIALPANRDRLTWLGRRRTHPLRPRDISMFVYFWTVYVPKVFFRRISPVETKRYAFFQNICALLFMAAIIIRAITALIQAQNRFEVRTGVENCGELPYTDNVRVLVRHGPLRRDPGNGSEWALGYSTGVQAIFDETTIVQCSSQLLPAWKALYRSGYSWEQNWFEVFTCTSQIRYSFYTASYNITIRETNATSLREFGLPSIWFTDSADSLQEPPISVNASLMRSVAPWLTPPWQLVAGANVQAKVGFARRRFIMSSVLRDIVVNLEPRYSIVSLFPIITTQSTPLPDGQTTTAILTPSLQPSLSFTNSRDFITTAKSAYSSMPAMCDFIEDYRSSTIFDALGSVGGLLAILQGVHILLFGRPMFWGIAGTKLISPFGIFGGCRSRAFKNRLRERYHHRTTGENGQPMDEPMDAIRINAFLRDFVIDFGPAEIEEDLTNGHGETNISAETRSQPEDNIITNNTTGMDDIPLLPHIQSRQDSESNYLSFDTIILK